MSSSKFFKFLSLHLFILFLFAIITVIRTNRAIVHWYSLHVREMYIGQTASCKMDINGHYITLHNGKIRIDRALTPSHLFTSMKTTGNVIRGLTLLTKRIVLPNIISGHLAVNFDTISRPTLLFKHLRFLVKTCGIRVHYLLSSSQEPPKCLLC